MANERARRLRRNATEEERILWSQMRKGRLESFKFCRQHPMGRFVIDFVCLERRLVIELDGGQHAEQAEYDARRTAALERLVTVVANGMAGEVMQRVRSMPVWFQGVPRGTTPRLRIRMDPDHR